MTYFLFALLVLMATQLALLIKFKSRPTLVMGCGFYSSNLLVFTTFLNILLSFFICFLLLECDYYFLVFIFLHYQQLVLPIHIGMALVFILVLAFYMYEWHYLASL